MGELVSPSQLVDDAIISWSEVDDASKPPAWVARRGRLTFEGTVNRHFIDQVAPYDRRAFDYALRLHEVAHVRYKSFVMREFGFPLQQWLFNLVEDVRIEYQMMAEFPGLVPYFRALPGFVKEGLQTSSGNQPTPDQAKVLKDTQILLDHLRFDKPAPNNWLVQFTEPRLEVVRRSASGGARLLSAQLLALLIEKDPTCARSLTTKIAVMGVGGEGGKRSKEEAGLVRIAKGLMKATGDGRTVDEICEGLGEDGGGEEGGPGSGSVVSQLIEQRDPRWDGVVQANLLGISALRTALQQIYTKVTLTDAKHGDLSLAPHKMQQAYFDSFSDGETSAPYYRVFKRDEHKADVLLVLDQSGSMQGDAQTVSDAAIITAAAIDNVKAVRLAAVGYGQHSGTTYIKAFASPAWAGDYTPIAAGGSPLGQCMKDAAASSLFAWNRGAARIVIICTDGAPNSWTDVHAAIGLDYYRGAIVVPLLIGRNNYTYASEYALACKRDPIEVSDGAAAAQAIATIIMREGRLRPWTVAR